MKNERMDLKMGGISYTSKCNVVRREHRKRQRWVADTVQNIKNTFLILSCTSSFALRTASICQSMDSTRCWIPQGCWSMLTPMLPIVVSSWLNVLWVVDHSWYTRETVDCEKPTSVGVLDTKRCTWHLLPYPIQRHLRILPCPFTIWMAHKHDSYLNCLKA